MYKFIIRSSAEVTSSADRKTWWSITAVLQMQEFSWTIHDDEARQSFTEGADSSHLTLKKFKVSLPTMASTSLWSSILWTMATSLESKSTFACTSQPPDDHDLNAPLVAPAPHSDSSDTSPVGQIPSPWLPHICCADANVILSPW